MSILTLGNEFGKTPRRRCGFESGTVWDEYLRGVISRWFVNVDHVHSGKHAEADKCHGGLETGSRTTAGMGICTAERTVYEWTEDTYSGGPH